MALQAQQTSSVPASQLTEEQRNILKQRGQYDINAYYNPEYLATLTGSTATTQNNSPVGGVSAQAPQAPSLPSTPTTTAPVIPPYPETPPAPEIAPPEMPPPPVLDRKSCVGKECTSWCRSRWAAYH